MKESLVELRKGEEIPIPFLFELISVRFKGSGVRVLFHVVSMVERNGFWPPRFSQINT